MSTQLVKYIVVIGGLLVFAINLRAEVSIRITTENIVSPGGIVTAVIHLDDPDGQFDMAGLDLLIQPDSSLSLQNWTTGQLLLNCGWEYFNIYEEPSGGIRIYAIADINNGAFHPSCYGSGGGELARISFELAPDFVGPCGTLSLDWFWGGCSNNTLTSLSGDTLYLSQDVFAFDGFDYTLIPRQADFPTGGGAPDLCLPNLRYVNYYNGAVLVSGPDNQPPLIICPGDTTVAAMAGQCGRTVVYQFQITDNCPGVQLSSYPPSGSFFPVGTTLVVGVATDMKGNSSQCSFNITVYDDQPPVITCPDDIYTTTDPGQCGANIDFSGSVIDNCPGAIAYSYPPSGVFFSTGTTTVVCIGLDQSGNVDSCYFDIHVSDAERPEISCISDTIIATDSGACTAQFQIVLDASDNCAPIEYSSEPPLGTILEPGETTILCLAKDEFDNVDSCRFNLSVVDIEPPRIICPADITVGNDSGLCGAYVEFSPTAEDNCPGATYYTSPESGSLFELGVTVVTAVAIDAAGNRETGQFQITIIDSFPPEILCPVNIVVENDSGLYGAVINYEVTAFDDCSEPEILSNPVSESVFPIGTTMVNVTATDPAGNLSACQFEVTVLLNDPDGDNLPNWDDNCPDDYNPDQLDHDGDGLGDICDIVYGDANGDWSVNIGDAVFLINYVFGQGQPPASEDAADSNCDQSVDIGDAVYLINYVFRGGPAPGCG